MGNGFADKANGWFRKPDISLAVQQLSSLQKPGEPAAVPGTIGPVSEQAGAQRGPWRVVGTREIYNNHWIRVREDSVVDPAGDPTFYGVVEFHGRAVGIVALSDDDQVYFVGQYRYPTAKYSWEIPAGSTEDDEDPLTAAQRELSEEAGLTASEWVSLGFCEFSNASTDQVGYLYLARGLTVGEPHPDPIEQLALKTVDLSEALAMTLDSRIFDVFTIAGLFRAWHYLRSNK